ncbi:unnamed protein product, partial [Effrenium voratum]
RCQRLGLCCRSPAGEPGADSPMPRRLPEPCFCARGEAADCHSSSRGAAWALQRSNPGERQQSLGVATQHALQELRFRSRGGCWVPQAQRALRTACGAAAKLK